LAEPGLRKPPRFGRILAAYFLEHIMEKKFSTSFTVYPTDANNMFPMIFGGAFFSQLDKAAATAVKRLLYGSDQCKACVTHKFEGTFHKPTYVGDLIFVEAEILSLGKKSVVVEVKAFREKPWYPGNTGVQISRELAAEAKFVFVTIVNDEDVKNKPNVLPYHDHGLTM
jgi:acyl-CoA hydrolase